jgi:nucleoside-diphosphate-sugar epimerase
MKVLITGHLGFIGPVMTRLFKSAGHHVVGLDTGYFRECVTDDPDYPTPDAEIVRDIRKVEAGDVKGMDAIVHLAGLSNDPLGQLVPELTADINKNATVRLATLAKENGVSRFVFASSCSLYGAADNTAPLTEEAAFNPVSAYALSKVNSEKSVLPLADENFSPVFLRNATAYGVSPRIRFDLVLNNLMGWARTTGRVKVMSDGTPWRPLVHIEDISRAALAAVEAPRSAIHGEAFNIGRNDANYQVREIAEAVARAVPDSTLEIVGESTGDTRSYRVDFTKALTTLPGFEPQWTLEKGCDELNQWFDNHTVNEASFESRQFIRLGQLNHLLDSRQLDKSLNWLGV